MPNAWFPLVCKHELGTVSSFLSEDLRLKKGKWCLKAMMFGSKVLDLGEINGQIGAASPVMQMQDCRVEEGAEAEALN